MTKPTCIIIQFPGSNCELETQRAAETAGFDAKIYRWNEDPSIIQGADAYVLPGGFSYQDRVRSGAISARLPVIQVLIKAAKAGKPILGICNGCQILAETGLIPNTKGQQIVEAALSPNKHQKHPRGFVCDWVYVKPMLSDKSLFMEAFEEGEVLPIPVNHGEGRFLFNDEIKDDLLNHAKFVYCDKNGQVSTELNVNPNGSSANIAGLTNPEGNVLAMMPHPERATALRQIPLWTQNKWKTKKKDAFNTGDISEGPWLRLFQSMLNYCRKTHEQLTTA